MKRRFLEEIIAALLCISLFLGLSLYAGRALMPEPEGYTAHWEQYAEEPENSIDVLVFGSSLAYCDVIPATIYAASDLTSYVMADPEQTLSVTYYYLKECLKTQSPQLILLEGTSLLFDEFESYATANVAYMPYSLNRIQAAYFAAPAEDRRELLFPMYAYHSRWDDVPLSTFLPEKHTTDPLAGYVYLSDATAQEERTARIMDVSQEIFQENVEYLRKIQSLCSRENIQLVLFFSPVFQYIPEERMAHILAAADALPILDYNRCFDDLPLDPDTDFYDYLHLNVSGAQKFSVILAGDLLTFCQPRPTATDADLWSCRVSYLQTLQGQE